MPDFRRARVSGGTYFFTVCTKHRRPILTSQPVYDALAAAMTDVRREYPFKVDAWVLLPDHLHCIWTLPEGFWDYSKRWSKIKRLVTQQCRSMPVFPESSRLLRYENDIWQRRFWEHAIRSETELGIHLDYIHWNPVKHGFVNATRDWSYSSFRRYVIKGVYDEDWGVSENIFEDREFGE